MGWGQQIHTSRLPRIISNHMTLTYIRHHVSSARQPISSQQSALHTRENASSLLFSRKEPLFLQHPISSNTTETITYWSKGITSCYFSLRLYVWSDITTVSFLFLWSSDGTSTTNSKCTSDPPCKHESRCMLKTEHGRASHYYCNCSSGYEGHRCHQGELPSNFSAK